MKLHRNLVVRKGNHRSTIMWIPFFRKSLNFSFEFDETHRFKEKSGQINKLFGFSDGKLDHHKSSFRIGYSNKGDTISIYSYTYVNSNRKFLKIGDVSIGKRLNVLIECRNDEYRVSVEEMAPIYVSRTSGSNYRYKHLLFPYYGGQNPAPKEVNHKLCLKL